MREGAQLGALARAARTAGALGEAHEAADRAEAAAVEAFWTHYRRRREPLRPAIARLVAAALSRDGARAAGATRRLFAEVVEPLCDAFTADAADAYRRTFAQVITAARTAPSCRGLDVALAARGVRGEWDLLRPHASRRGPKYAATRARVRRVTVLSRLTLGADVAICLPVLARASRLFPQAEIRFVGGEGARVVAGGVPGVRHVPADYGRNDHLCDRLNAWLGVCAATADGAFQAPAESIVIDPDSRLTQLGLLPPAPRRAYYHFPSRTAGGDRAASLGELVAEWLDETFGADAADRRESAALALAPRDAEWSRALRAALLGGRPSAGRSSARRASSRPPVTAGVRGAPFIVSVSLGVGGNDRKRVGEAFEADLLEWIVARGARVLLARGAGDGEVARSFALAERLAARGLGVLHLERGRRLGTVPESGADIVTWEADVGAFLAAVGCADIYVGYDSAGQHLAAALGVPMLSVFVEAAGARHALRWTPRGRGEVRVVRSPWPPDARAVLARAQAELLGLMDAAAPRASLIA